LIQINTERVLEGGPPGESNFQPMGPRHQSPVAFQGDQWLTAILISRNEVGQTGARHATRLDVCAEILIRFI